MLEPTREKKYYNWIDSPKGFSKDLKMSENDLKTLRKLINEGWLRRIQKVCPDGVELFKEGGIENYHLNAHLLDHEKIWPKPERMFSPKDVATIKNLDFYKRLEKEFGSFLITNEENVYDEEIYWRLVRPGRDDIGPLHADEWFWVVQEKPTPQGYRRVKIWMAIYCVPGKSGLRYVEGSHHNEVPYNAVEKFGGVRPQIAVADEDLNVEAFLSDPGDCFVFHDKLLHGGMENKSDKTRVSAEFTFLVKE